MKNLSITLTKTLTENTEKRIFGIAHKVEEYCKDDKYSVVTKALSMHSDDCHKLFKICNEALEDVENLIAMLINGLFDDGFLQVYVEPNNRMYLNHGHDDLNVAPIKTEDVIKAIDIYFEKRNALKTYKNRVIDRKEYFEYQGSLTEDLEELLLPLCSEAEKEKFKKNESLRVFKIQKILSERK